MLASTPNILQMCSFDANKSTKGASKLRRDLINAEIANLRDLLPLPSSTRQRLSQLQLMALVCVYVRKANYFQHGGLLFRKHQVPPELPMPHFGFSKALSGFLMMMTQNGKLLYISDNAAEYLGHSMEDLLIHGDSVYDIIEKQDHQVIQTELLRTPSPLSLVPDSRIFLCRMNVSRNARRQMRFGDQKVVLVQGHFVSFLPLCSRNEPVFLATCTPVAMPETRECVVQGSTNVFTSIHSMDMKFLHVDRNGEFHLGCTKSSLQGLSWYELVHWEHLREAQSKHRLITQSEQERSCILLLRLQTGPGKWIWTHVVLQVKDGSDSSQQPVIVCTNQVLSEREASVMRANSWLYQFYSLHSKMHYGLAYDAHATRLPTPYYSAMLPFHHPPTSTETTAHAHHHHHPTYHLPPPPPPPQPLNGSSHQSVFQHYGAAASHQGSLATPYTGLGMVPTEVAPPRWPSLKRPASPDHPNLELCKSSFQPHPPPPPPTVRPGYGVYAASSLSGGGLSVPSLSSVMSGSGYFGGPQLLSSVPYPTIGRFRSQKSSVSEDEVTDVEQSLTPTNTEDVSNMISAHNYLRSPQAYHLPPTSNPGPSPSHSGGGPPGSAAPSQSSHQSFFANSAFHGDPSGHVRRMPDAYETIHRRDDYFDRPAPDFSGKLYPDTNCSHLPKERGFQPVPHHSHPVNDDKKGGHQWTFNGSPRYFPQHPSEAAVGNKDYRSYSDKDTPSIHEGSPYPVYEEIGRPVDSNSSRPPSETSRSLSHCRDSRSNSASKPGSPWSTSSMDSNYREGSGKDMDRAPLATNTAVKRRHDKSSGPSCPPPVSAADRKSSSEPVGSVRLHKLKEEYANY